MYLLNDKYVNATIEKKITFYFLLCCNLLAIVNVCLCFYDTVSSRILATAASARRGGGETQDSAADGAAAGTPADTEPMQIRFETSLARLNSISPGENRSVHKGRDDRRE